MTVGVAGLFGLLLVASALSDGEPAATPPPVAQATPTVSPETSPTPAPEPTQTEIPSPTIAGTLGLTPEEFRDQWNAAALEFEMDALLLPGLTVSSGEVQDVFQHGFSEHLAMLGAVNKADGSIREVTLLADGQEPLATLAAWGIVVAATNPALSAAERGDVLRELGIIGSDDFTGIDREAVRGTVRYHFQHLEALGLFLYATDARIPD